MNLASHPVILVEEFTIRMAGIVLEYQYNTVQGEVGCIDAGIYRGGSNQFMTLYTSSTIKHAWEVNEQYTTYLHLAEL